MEMLLERPAAELYGLELVRNSGRRLKRGTVYVTLARLEEKGFIESHEEAADPTRPGIPRRLYKATAFGQRACELLRQVQEARELALANRAEAI